MTNDELNQIEARAAAAQGGPWWTDDEARVLASLSPAGVLRPDPPCTNYVVVDRPSGAFAPTREFIAHAREDVPALVAEVRRVKGVLKDVLRLLETEFPQALECDHRETCARCKAWETIAR